MRVWVLAVAFLLLSSATYAFGVDTKVIFATPTPDGIAVPVENAAAERSLGLESGALKRTVFFHYNDEINHIQEEDDNTCFKESGIAWQDLPLSYAIHPDMEAKDPDAISAGAKGWNDATSAEIFNTSATFDGDANWDVGAPDSVSEFSIGPQPDDVVAATVVWSGIPLGGNIPKIVEFDVLFSDRFDWGDASSPADQNTGFMMDVHATAMHEMRHIVKMSDARLCRRMEQIASDKSDI